MDMTKIEKGKPIMLLDENGQPLTVVGFSQQCPFLSHFFH